MSGAIQEPDTERLAADSEADSLSTAWAEYKETGSAAARDRLILHYSPLVKYVAGRVAVGLPANIEQADLISYGIFGLIDAIDKYDRDRGIKFETYAISRIRGSIIDELRAIDWVPRSVRFKANVSIEELNHIYTQLSTVSLVALDELMSVEGDRGDRLSLVETLEDTKTAGPVDTVEAQELRNILAEAVNRLPEREKIVVTLYYYEGLTLAEIGQVLGVTESRVCQMHTKAVLGLRGKISEATTAD
jgi:RNA polymerase sigma factor for flagellar operon FliA